MSTKEARTSPSRLDRPTSWWLAALKKRRARMYDEKLVLGAPPTWSSEQERNAAIAFFNAAFRAEESGLRQAHELAAEVEADDPELAETLRLYGDEEGWHRELLTEFLQWLGGDVRPMGRVTGTFYRLYGRAERMDTIVLTNLMFETIGSTTYRLALRTAEHPTIRQMLTILTRDESFHVPLNVHFLRRVLARNGNRIADRVRLTALYHTLTLALVGSAIASRRKAKAFDRIEFRTLGGAYVEQLGGLFLRAPDLGLRPSRAVLAAFGLTRKRAERAHDRGGLSMDSAEHCVDRERVVVTAY